MTPLRWSPGPHPTGEVARELRLCLDLNVWAAAIHSHRMGRRNTASQVLTEAALDGRCALGPTRLVVSWPMLGRLEKVLVDYFRVPPADARKHTTTIARAAAVDSVGGPYLVLGGSGLVPLRDEEDAHVLEAAVAGRADMVVTMNFKDFVNYRTRVVIPNRIAIHTSAQPDVLIAHPAVAAGWIRAGRITLDPPE